MGFACSSFTSECVIFEYACVFLLILLPSFSSRQLAIVAF